MRSSYPTVTFRYTVYHGKSAPIIPLQIQGKDRWHKIWVYVDSGASQSIFSSKIAELLGLDLKRGRRIDAVAGDGNSIPVYVHSCFVKIGSQLIRAAIGFSEELRVGFNLLGRQDIFTSFRICFDDMKKEIAFHAR